MRKTVVKLFFLWDFDKEEEWLNKMAASGLHLVGVGFCTYAFEEGAPREYAVRLELLDQLPGNYNSRRYIEFIEDTGAEFIGSMFRWAYFRKRTDHGGFDLFSNIDSRIRHLNRILLLNVMVLPLMLFSTLNTLDMYLSGRAGASVLLPVVLCGSLFLLGAYGVVRTYIKKRRLKKERSLYE